MPSYYYIDLFYDNDMGKVVESSTGALLKHGCRFKRIMMQESKREDSREFFERNAEVTLENMGDLARAYLADMRARGHDRISFPPWGRVVFEYDFEFDEEIAEDVRQEELETRSCAKDMGVSFLCEDNPAIGAPRVVMSLSFWEEYVLLLGRKETHDFNMRGILEMLEKIYDSSKPFFGAMNNEIHINTEKSYGLLLEGSLPEGNEFVLVGRKALSTVDADKLTASGYKWRVLSDGGIIVQFAQR